MTTAESREVRIHNDETRVAVETCIGRLGLMGSDAGLREVTWSAPRGWSKPNRRTPAPLRAAQAALEAYFVAPHEPIPDLELDLGKLTEFQISVLQVLAASVPAGETIGYGELAERVGRPGAARAVGTVMARNPLPLVFPCHRVVASAGPGGFGPGLELKRQLLNLEGVQLRVR